MNQEELDARPNVTTMLTEARLAVRTSHDLVRRAIGVNGKAWSVLEALVVPPSTNAVARLDLLLDELYASCTDLHAASMQLADLAAEAVTMSVDRSQDVLCPQWLLTHQFEGAVFETVGDWPVVEARRDQLVADGVLTWSITRLH